MAASSCLITSRACAVNRVRSEPLPGTAIGFWPSQYICEIPRLSYGASNANGFSQIHGYPTRRMNSDFFGQHLLGIKVNQSASGRFSGVATVSSQPNFGISILHRKRSAVFASWLASSQIANTAFTLGTVAVLPFYTSMVVAPQSVFTKKLMGSSVAYIALGILYVYLLYLSWTPETIHLMFANKYWLPELSGIAKMFSSEMTLASAWIHLLAIDLFAARQIYFDGLQSKVETRHSTGLCLLFCPVGVLVHFLSKALTASANGGEKTEAGSGT